MVGLTFDENKSPHSDAIKSNIKLLKYLENLITEVPPEPTQGRFGNKSFKIYHDRFDSEIDTYLLEILQ